VIIDVEIVAVYVSQYDQEYSFAYVRDITEGNSGCGTPGERLKIPGCD